MSKRRGDPDELDPRPLREPVAITMNERELAAAIAYGRRRAFKVGVITAVVVSAIVGLIVGRVVTDTVRDDVGQAAVTNCKNTQKAAAALTGFLSSDAAFNRKLSRRDRRSGQVEKDLSVQVRKLGPLLPPRIAGDFLANGVVHQQLASLRAAVADLWVGAGKHAPSLARDVFAVVHAHCDRILTP